MLKEVIHNVKFTKEGLYVILKKKVIYYIALLLFEYVFYSAKNINFRFLCFVLKI